MTIRSACLYIFCFLVDFFCLLDLSVTERTMSLYLLLRWWIFLAFCSSVNFYINNFETILLNTYKFIIILIYFWWIDVYLWSCYPVCNTLRFLIWQIKSFNKFWEILSQHFSKCWPSFSSMLLISPSYFQLFVSMLSSQLCICSSIFFFSRSSFSSFTILCAPFSCFHFILFFSCFFKHVKHLYFLLNNSGV